MASNTTKSDTGAIYGATYSAIIDGVLFVLKTVDHSLGVSGFTITDKNGQFAGGVYVVEPETVQVEIDAIAGIAPPSRFVPFEKAFHGFAAKYWMIHNLVIKSGNAQGRTYLAELKQSFPATVSKIFENIFIFEDGSYYLFEDGQPKEFEN